MFFNCSKVDFSHNVRENKGMKKDTRIDDYIAKFPQDIQTILRKVRTTIQTAAPQAEEGFVYGVPSFTLGKYLVGFAAFKKHIGLYPTPSGITHFKRDLQPYKTSKGAITFPLEEKIPYTLIAKIVKYRVRENRK